MLAEPIEDCLLAAPDGDALPGGQDAARPRGRAGGCPRGNIFHRDLAWPFAEHEDEVGAWGTETENANVLLCGAGARRGGGVSGIPGHNAAMAILGAVPATGRLTKV